MYAFYIPRGHSLRELEELSVLEKRFYIGAMEKYYTEIFTIADMLILSMFGTEKDIKRYQEDLKRRYNPGGEVE